MASSTYDAWDARYNRPIVGGRVTNPTTGVVEQAGTMFVAGPPSIEAIWVNLSASPRWQTIVTSLNCPIDDALCQIASHIQQGIYSIVSLNASAYSLKIMCKSEQSLEEMLQSIQTLKVQLNEDQDHEDETSPTHEDAPPVASGGEGGASSGPAGVEEEVNSSV